MQRKTISKKYEKITTSFTEADSDLVEYLEELKKSNKASEFVRDAIREKMNNSIGLNSNKGNDFNNKIESIENRINNIENLILKNNLELNINRNKDILEKEESIMPKVEQIKTLNIGYGESIADTDVDKNIFIEKKEVSHEESDNVTDELRIDDVDNKDESIISAVNYFDF